MAFAIVATLFYVVPAPAMASTPGSCFLDPGQTRLGLVRKEHTAAPVWDHPFSWVGADATVAALLPCSGHSGTAGSYVKVVGLEDDHDVNRQELGYMLQGTAYPMTFYYTPGGAGAPVAWPGSLRPIAGREYRFTVRAGTATCPCTAVFTIYDLAAGVSQTYSGGTFLFSTSYERAYWGVGVTDTRSFMGRNPGYVMRVHSMNYQWWTGNGVTGWRNGLTVADLYWYSKHSCEGATISTTNSGTPSDTVDWWWSGC